MGKRKGKSLQNEGELEADGAAQHHKRKQKALNSINWVLCFIIYALPVLVLIWVLVMAWHLYSIQDWNGLNVAGLAVVTHSTAYLIGIIQKQKWLESGE